MAVPAELIETEALALPLAERTCLAIHLKRPGTGPEKTENAWLTEANHRYQAFLNGKEQAISTEDVFTQSPLAEDTRY